MNIDIPIHAKFEGYFILVAHKCDDEGKVIPGTARHLAEFKNLITDSGLDMIGNNVTGQYVQVGSGSTAPSTSDTSLVSRVASTSNATSSVASYVTGPPEYAQIVITWRFAAGLAAGNLSEIGVAGGTVSPLFSRALILDGVGAPTTITVLASEALDCVYVLRLIPPPADTTGSANVSITGNAVTYNWTCRPASIGTGWSNLLNIYSTGFGRSTGPFLSAYDGALGTRATQPSGNESSATSWTGGSYSNGSRSIIYTGTFGLTQANFGNGITAFQVSGGVGQFQIGINGGANIPKTSNQTLTGVTFNFTWSR